MDFFRSEDYWKDKRELWSKRTKEQFANMTEKEKQVWSEKCSSREVREKRSSTMRENNSFVLSDMENNFCKRIRKIYPDTIHQYWSKEYPYNCDFYIPSLKLYIETHFHWSHGKRPYLGTKEDKEIVAKWRKKNTRSYQHAIHTWTELDVKKREIAKKNKLNFKELFSIKEAENYLDKLENRNLV